MRKPATHLPCLAKPKMSLRRHCCAVAQPLSCTHLPASAFQPSSILYTSTLILPILAPYFSLPLCAAQEPQALKFPHGVPSRGFIPPVFFYGGQVNRLLEVPGVDSGQELAIKDMASMLVWILFQLNIVDESTVRESERSTTIGGDD